MPADQRKFWEIPPQELIKDPSCFVKVHMEWFSDNPPSKVFYTLDLLDNKLNHGTAEEAINNICTRIATIRDHHDLLRAEFWKPFSAEKYVLLYRTSEEAEGHACIYNKNADGTFNTDDQLIINDMRLTTWLFAELVTFK